MHRAYTQYMYIHRAGPVNYIHNAIITARTLTFFRARRKRGESRAESGKGLRRGEGRSGAQESAG